MEAENGVPEFPAIMKGIAGEFAALYSSCLESPPHFFYMAYLTCLGSALADRLTVNSELTVPPRLYTILLGESADTRKSTAIDRTVDFFREAVTDFHVLRGVGSAEGLQATMEKVKSPVLLALDEFKAFVGKCNIDSSVLLPSVNTLFESTTYENCTKKHHVCINNGHLSLLAASTVNTYEKVWTSKFRDIGFDNRLFIVPGNAEKRFSIPPKVPDRRRYSAKQRLGEILLHVADGLELDFTAQALDTYHEWYMNQEKSVHVKRLDTYALRLMALLAVNELKQTIDHDVVMRAILLTEWQLQARKLYDPIDADNKVARLEEKIRRVLNFRGPLTDRDLKRFTNPYDAGLWAYKNARDNLLASREIALNRKKRVWYLLDGKMS